jgi:hypothetical protein
MAYYGMKLMPTMYKRSGEEANIVIIKGAGNNH